MHALIRDGAIVETRRLKAVENDGTRDWDLRGDDGTLAASIGWLPLVYADRPADTATTTWDQDEPRLIADVPTVTWVERDKTAEEIAAEQQSANAQTIAADATSDNPKIVQSITDLATLLGDSTTVGSIRAWKQPFTNNATLTGAQGKALADLVITQAQADRRIARQVLRLARLVTGDTSSADVGAE